MRIMQLLGPGVSKHQGMQVPKKESAVDVHGSTCIHVVDGKTCGLHVGADYPNGWLCPAHQDQLFPWKRQEPRRATH